MALVVAATFACVAVSCRALTPIEIVLDEQARGQLIGWAKEPDRTWGPFGTPASTRVEGRWTLSEWRFSGQVYEMIELLDVGWQAGRRYRYRPVGAGTKRADCTVGFRHRFDRGTIETGVEMGPDKGACLQLLYPELRLDR
jgi:hypothetical protein